ncbi:hypothetical protein BUALT_Bualt14G0005500 [Buddleja alternifolia]|uniref:DUF4218 domain-containing protein n=1 Tax=Buddleja alternifolia TaxID=168488 RepID=A0AAV6WR48_9LAMI|nr:hypothetical protein BUALT_Bualt14G0005500 [Buddleja alternifolia]
MGDYNVENHRHWKKRSIFFELPYWKHNMIRHNLDVMHIEKNVCDNVIFTLLNVKGKTKDNLNARHELAKLGVRKPLHAFKSPSERWCLPPGPCNMGLSEKDTFCKILKSIKAPDGYASNISKCIQIEKRTIWGLKSHDNHVLMQNLLPIAVRKALPKHVVEVLIELSTFFRKLCSKVNDRLELEKVQDRIAVTLCYLERIFPPSFFDIMDHLSIHLAEEALIGGAVQYRFLMTLKKYMRNKAHPEGSIAKGYILEECMTFCSRYLNDVKTNANNSPRNYDGDSDMGRLIGNGKEFHLNHVTWVQAHRYVLQNSDVIEKLRITSGDTLPEDIITLSKGPNDWGQRYKSCVVHGFRFRVKALDTRKKTQNSGVFCSAYTSCYASSKDKRPQTGTICSFFMAGKRKRSGRSVNDVIRERAGSSSMHDSPSRDRGRRVHLRRFGSTSSLPLHDASHSSSSGISVNPSEDCHNIGHPAPYFPAEHHVSDLPSCSGDIFHANGNSNHSHCAPSVPIEHPNRADFPSCSGSNVNTSTHLKKGRGRSKPISRWNKDGKLQLELTLDGEIHGPDRVEFKTQLGVKARNAYRFPLIYTSFDCIPQLLLADLWSEVKVLEDFNEKWQQGKYELKKKYFRPYQNDHEKLKELTVDLVPPEQFKYLVDYWKLVETQEEAERNTQNIAQHKFHHNLGRTPILELKKKAEASNHLNVDIPSLQMKLSRKKIQEVVQEVEEKMRGEKEQMRKEIDEMKEEREKMKGLMEQMEKKMSQTREEMTQEVVENVVSYFGLGHLPVAPFIGQSVATF